MAGPSEPRRLRLLSYNIQSGLTTRKYSQYLTRSWKHLVPVPSRMNNLDGIARILAGYDIVGLQEVDAGSLRSGFVNQVKYLADSAGFKHVFDQANRKIGMISQHGNAMLSRFRPSAITEHKLPGLIPGRGVLEVRFGGGEDALHVLISHMALGRRGRLRQIEFLVELVSDCRHVILMGDLNCISTAARTVPRWRLYCRRPVCANPDRGCSPSPVGSRTGNWITFWCRRRSRWSGSRCYTTLIPIICPSPWTCGCPKDCG